MELLRPLGALLVGALAVSVAACGGGSSNSTAKPSDGEVARSRHTSCSGFAWCDTTLSAEQRTALLLDALTLEEKFDLMAGDDPVSAATGDPAVGVVNGIPRVGIKPVYYSDGPVGVREGQTTAHPAPILLASTFNPALAGEVGAAIAQEVKFKGNDVVHAPTVDVVRLLQHGRVFETYGEDPFLASRMAVPWIEGAESQGIIANVKHYVMNNQEGLIGLPPITGLIGARILVNAQVDERTLREIYLPPFEAAVVEAGVGSVMCAYNFVNGQPACSNDHLLQTILRDEWGFGGYVLTDYYFAQKDTIQSVNNGTDLEMPLGVNYNSLSLNLAVASTLVSEETIDKRVGNILRTLFRYGFMDRESYPVDDSLIDKVGNGEVARRTAEQGIVLLTNNGLLPLSSSGMQSVAVIGESADRYVNGGGSSAVEPFDLITPLAAIIQRAAPARVEFDPGDNADSAAALASQSDIALVFVTDNATEGEDRTCLSLSCPTDSGQNQDALIEAVAAANPNTVVVLQTGSAVLTPWRDRVAGVLAAWYPGQYGGPALAAALFGDSNPSGRLPLTFPEFEADTPTANNIARYPGLALPDENGGTVFNARYDEGVLVGYRWYDHQGIEPAFPFGFGLSYSDFHYRDLSVSGSGPNMTVSAQIDNTSARDGAAVPQLYVSIPSSGAEVQPPRQLKGFQRLQVLAGGKAVARFQLNARSFSYWDEGQGSWRIAPGCYRIAVASHSRDPGLGVNVPLAGGSCP